MKIAFDLRWIRSEKIDGTSRYAINLVSYMLRTDTANHYTLIGNRTLVERLIPNAQATARVQIVDLPQRLLSPQDFLLAPHAIARLNVDAYHSPSYLASPFQGNYHKILTVFDLIPLLFPEALSKSRLFWKLFYATHYPAAAILHSADTIVTCSENTKHDIVRLLKISAEKIRVVWSGIEERFHPASNVPEDFFKRYSVPQQFLLYVGRQDPYKGIGYLVQAFALLPKELQHSYAVVIAGSTDQRYIGDVHALVAQHSLQDRVYFLDYVPDEDLPALYNAATLLAHPSLYEGFGLTPLEAMACGTPVAYANTSSLTELLGDAGYAVEPASAESLAEGIRNLLEHPELQKDFIARGKNHVQRYSWENVAREMLNMYSMLSGAHKM